ncbi:hypothetical protein ACLKA7_008394 [Drosophila subpalustris]
MIFNPTAKNLFDEDDDELLQNIEILTGIRLKEDPNMPKHICTCCHLDLYHSMAFRERCLRAENFLQFEQQNVTTGGTPEIIKSTSQKLINMVNKSPTASSDSKLDTDSEATDYSEESSSISSVELSNWSGEDLSSIFSESELEETLPSPTQKKTSTKEMEDALPKPIEEQLPKQIDELTKNVPNESKKKKKKPTNPKMYICDLCGYSTPQVRFLDLHILRHKKEKNFECTECGEKFYTKHLLELHVRVRHKGETPFSCKYCDQRFYTSSARLRHEKVRHIKDFKYECKICGKKYNTSSCLKKHEFLHTGQRPYRCDLCNVGFPRRPALRIHCRTKLHQKRESEALNSQVTVINEITIPNGSIVFTDSIIEEFVDA